MLINFKQSIRKHNLKISGIIHVGAHYGQEYVDYETAGIKNIVFIEPCEKAFGVLESTFKDAEGVQLFNCACGAYNGTGVMNTETANTGMSNSLLKPAKHLRQYPSIQFEGVEEVHINLLDALSPAFTASHNTLVMDVQGFELEVLKGAQETLKVIDYIYTEVNRDEVYENCARVEHLDEFLSDFTRVETNWAGGTWGDAWYIRKGLI